MTTASELVSAVQFNPVFDVDQLHFNEDLGFLQVEAADVAVGALRVLGFGTPLARTGGFDVHERPHLITDYRQLAPEHRTADLQAKGVGLRLYNTVQAYAGAPYEQATELGAYVTVDIDPNKVLDLRGTQGGMVAQIARHARRKLRSGVGDGLQRVTDEVHASYGDADVVVLGQPPAARLRQWWRHASDASHDVPAAFMIVRNPVVAVRRVGQIAIG